MLAEDIAKLMNAIPLEEQTKRNEGMDRIEGGAFEGVMDKQTPFQVRIQMEYIYKLNTSQVVLKLL